jgi:hypothetical protein
MEKPSLTGQAESHDPLLESISPRHDFVACALVGAKLVGNTTRLSNIVVWI